MNVFSASRTIVLVLFAAFLAVPLTAAKVLAQSGAESSYVIPLEASSQDRAAANNVLNFRYHLLPANTDAARGVPLNGPERRSPLISPEAPETKSAIPLPRSGLSLPKGFYPADLSYFGGAVVTSAVHDNVYFNCSNESCWGNPVEFLTDLGKSKFVHLVDQYVHSTLSNRYTMGSQLTATANFCSSSTFCSANEILGIAHAAANTLGGNPSYSHLIHIFLPPGTDTCFEDGVTCYSNVFCAYHSSATFNDSAGHVVFTVEPFQQVLGCDSTNSALSHEVFETITDPDGGSGWLAINTLMAEMSGAEIGDLCLGRFDGNFLIGTSVYQVQLEYSNKYHACVSVP